MNPITRALHIRVDTDDARPAVTPVYQTSAFEAQSLYFYTRKNNPNLAEFEEVIRTIEGSRHGVAVSTGMAAIRVCLDLLRPGDTMVLNELVYGCTFRLVERFCAQFSVDLRILDLTTADGVNAIPTSSRLVLLETPTNPFLRTVDITSVAAAAKRNNPGALVIVDNTWATSLYQHPLEFGADVSLHSATKYMSGHSDVMGGILLTNRDELADAFRQTRFYSGAVLDPHSAWLLRRSMQTFGVRLAHQGRVTAEMREFLTELPQVAKVYYPKVDGHQLSGYGGIIFFELRPHLVDRYDDFVASLQHFGTGTAMACVTSMVARPFSGSHASMTVDEKRKIGLSPALVRLCFGLEDPEDLRSDLRQAFAKIDQPAR